NRPPDHSPLPAVLDHVSPRSLPEPPSMNRTIPLTAILLGLAGLIPFIGCGLLATGDDATRDQGFTALIAYGAVILSFVGAVHWGLALGDGAASRQVQRIRY